MKPIFSGLLAGILLQAPAVKAQQTLIQRWTTIEHIPVPESVLPVKKKLYVSLIDGAGNEKDGKGGVAILNRNGTVKNLNWVTGLNAPKGMGLYKNKLYVADLTEVVVIDMKGGKIIKKIPIPNSVFLNDITIDKKGAVYVSDTRQNKIHKIVNDQPGLYMDNVPGANGLKSIGTDLFVLAGKELWKLDKDKNKTIIVSVFEQAGDGIEPVNEADFIVTCWPGIIYYVKGNGEFYKLLDVQGSKNTADLGYDAKIKTVYIPTFNANSVISFELR